MKHRSKRLLSILLTLALMLGLVPGMSLTAYAEYVCPQCSSTEIVYNEEEGEWFCNGCGTSFVTPAGSDGSQTNGVCPHCGSTDYEPWADDWYSCNSCDDVFVAPVEEVAEDSSRIGSVYHAGDTLPKAFYYDDDDDVAAFLKQEIAIYELRGCVVDVDDVNAFIFPYRKHCYLYFRPSEPARGTDAVTAVKISSGGGSRENPYQLTPQYPVSFNSNGGSPAPSAQQVWRGDKVTAPAAPTREGCEFAGWFNGNTQWDFNQNSVDYPITLTAHWNVPVTSVSLPDTAALTVDGEAVALTATVEPAEATDKTVKWSTTGGVTLYSDENCTAGNEIGANATATLTVYAKGISAGTATVTATSNADSTKTASCDVTVNAAQTQTHTHDEISFQPWTSTDSLPTESGSYYLTQDVTLSGTWNVPTGETNLCLNGHSIILSGSGSVISVPEGATLNLYDCDETTHYITLTGGRGTDVSTTQPNGTANYLKVTGGCITGGTGTSNNGRDYGGGVYVNGGTFTMSGGTIIGNTANYGGGVYVNGGTFTMSGGTIIGNTVNYGGGGGVYNNCGSFTMQGGEITGNKAQNGGGVYNNSTFTMQGGEITGNTAGNGGNGGGVYVQDGSFTMTGGNIVGNKTGGYGSGGGVYVNKGSFNLSGGSITDNTAYGNGGGVYNYSTFTMEAGSITGNKAQNGGGVYNNGTFTMTGAPVIKDNTKGTGESAPKNNVYLYDSKITVNGALSGSAEVGVTMKTPGVFTSSADPIKASGYKDCFSSDDSTYTVTTDGNELKLSSHEHDFTYSATGATITATCTVDGCALPPSSQGGTDHVAKLTIAAPTLGTYGQTGGGISAEATVTDASSIKGNATVVYKKGDETLSSAPTNAGTYTASITVGGATASVEYTIAQKEVTVSGITASDKVYDGNTDATLVTTAATVTGKLDGDALTVSATGTFDNANVGENKTVTISELTFGGSSKDNYKLASTGSQTTTTAKITAKAVGLTWSNTELAYTGEAQKPTATATGVVDGDTCTVTVSGEQTNVGDDYTATAASLSNSNYKLPENKTTTFKIVKGNAVPVTVTANNRTYDGTEKPLVTVTGEATGGEMQYALGENATTAPADNLYTTSIPAKTDAGTYYVWYKVKAGANHSDTEAKALTVTISAPAPAPSGGGGSSTTATVTIPVSSEDGKTSVNVTVQVSGSTATVTSADVDKVLDAKDVGNVTVNVESLNKNVDEVVLPAALVEKVAKAVADNGNDASGLEIKLPTGTVTFDATTVATLAQQSNGKDLKVHLDNVSQATLTSAQQNAVKDVNALVVLDAYVTADGKRISDFSGGKATFSVPVELGDGQTAAGVTAYFVAENGEKTEIPCTYDGKNATGTVEHFSNYVVTYDESRVTKPEPQPEPEPEPTPGPATPTDIGYDDLSDDQKKDADAVASALGVDKDTAAQMVKLADELGVSIDTVKLSGAALAKMNVDSSDPAGTDFGKLTARVTKRTNSALTLKWTKQKNADGYLIYGNKCGKGNKMKLLKTIKKNGTVSFTQKKLKKGTYYKYMVVAYKNVNGKKMPIAASVVLHAPTKGGKVTVAKSVKVTNTKKKAITKATVKKGKTFQLKASEVKDEKKLKVKTHRAVKFESSDPKIAKVNAKGKITGKKKGKATVWAYAQNGIFKAIQVTVK